MPPSTEINVPCPGCRTAYQVPAGLAGTPMTCEACGTDFTLPGEDRPAGRTASAPVPAPAPLTRPSGAGTDGLPGFSSTPPEHPAPESSPAPELPGPRPLLPEPEPVTERPASAMPRRHGFLKSALLVLLGAGLVVLGSQFLPSPTVPDSAEDPAEAGLPLSGNRGPDRGTALTPVITVTPPAKVPPVIATSAPPAPTGTDPASSLPPPPPVVLKADAPAATPVPEAGEPDAGPDTSLPSSSSGEPENPPPAAPALPSSPPVPAASGSRPAGAAPAPSSPSPAEAAETTPDPAGIRKDSRKTLERFFQSTTLEQRLAYSQNPGKVRAEMEAYYHSSPIAPVPLEGLAFLTEGTLPGNKRVFHLYNAFVRDQLAPIPMAVEQTSDGFRVDWQTFTECHSGKLKRFFAEPGAPAGRFRVVLRRAHYFGPPVPGQDTDRLPYTVEPPTREESWPVWANRDSKVYQKALATGERSTWDAESYAIVELAWSGGGEDGRWVTLTKILADSWRPE